MTKMKEKICIIGLGYIGLPTSTVFATHGFEVLGVDTNKRVVEALNKGKIIIEEPGLDILVRNAVESGNLSASIKPQSADVFLIAVPTPITVQKKADLSYVIAAAKGIVPYLRQGNTVILESTSPIGTIEEVLAPILSTSGLIPGEDFYLGYSPERVLPGQIIKELISNTRIVGGINQISAEKIRSIYNTFVKGDILLTSATTAEMCKMMENTFRDVNIALANELAKICETIGINAWEVIELCNKHPRVNLHQPGPGVGGHCLAVDPWFIVEKVPETAAMIKLAREINDSMTFYVFERVNSILKKVEEKKKVTILGITYKPNIDDIRESPILALYHLLRDKEDYIVSIFDPHVKGLENQEEDIFKAVETSDLLLLGVNHDIFKDLPWGKMATKMRHRNLLDAKNFLNGADVMTAGFTYYLLGEGRKEDYSIIYKQLYESAYTTE